MHDFFLIIDETFTNQKSRQTISPHTFRNIIEGFWDCLVYFLVIKLKKKIKMGTAFHIPALPPLYPPPHLKEVKFFVCRAILFNFKTWHFHFFLPIMNEIKIGVPSPPPFHKKNIQTYFSARFWWDLKPNVLIYLPIMKKH